MVCACDSQYSCCHIWLSAQMQFKYAQKGGIFERGVVLARQFLGEGPWEVWDLSPDCDKWCQACSSKAERIVRHDGTCPTKSSRKASGQQRALARRKSIAEARIRPVVVGRPRKVKVCVRVRVRGPVSTEVC